MKKIVLLFLSVSMLMAGCGGQSNISDCDNGKKPVPCTEKSAAEKGRLALDAKNFEQAAEFFLTAIEDDDENYNLYTLLSTAYAGAAGFNLLDVTKAQISGEGSIVEIMGAFLPTPAKSCTTDGGDTKEFVLCIASMELALGTAKLPDAALADTTADYFKTASKQRLFYGSASTVMQINRFTISASTGTFDPAQLETMTEDDALAIIATLSAAGNVPGLSDEEGQVLQSKLAEAEADIQSQDGGSTKAKLAAFINKEQTGDPQ